MKIKNSSNAQDTCDSILIMKITSRKWSTQGNRLQDYKIVWKLYTIAGILTSVILMPSFASVSIVCLIDDYLYA